MVLFNVIVQCVIMFDILYRQNSKYSDKLQNKGFSAMTTGGGGCGRVISHALVRTFHCTKGGQKNLSHTPPPTTMLGEVLESPITRTPMFGFIGAKRPLPF